MYVRILRSQAGVGIKIWGAQFKSGGSTISKGYKSGGGAPMVKIKDFTLASKNPPCPTVQQWFSNWGTRVICDTLTKKL